MQHAVTVSMGIFLLTTTWVGLRLTSASLRTRAVPEAGFGIGFLAGGLALQCYFAQGFAPEAWRSVIDIVGRCAMSASVFAASLGAWRLFRPDARWALGLVFCATGAQVVGQLVVDSIALSCLGAGLSYAWPSYESQRQASILRRRTRIGLGNPLAAARFQAWALGAGAGAAIQCIRPLARMHVLSESGATFAMSVLGLAAGFAFWFAFYPPRAWSNRYAVASAVSV